MLRFLDVNLMYQSASGHTHTTLHVLTCTRATPRQGTCVCVEANLQGTSAARAIIYRKCITRKCLILKMNVKVMECTSCSGPIRWQISTSIKVILEHFSLALTAFEIFTFQNSSSEKYRSRTFVMAPFDGKNLTSHLTAIVRFAFFYLLLMKITT